MAKNGSAIQIENGWFQQQVHMRNQLRLKLKPNDRTVVMKDEV